MARYSDALATLGLPVCQERAVVRGANGLIAFHRAIAEKRDALPFDIDGVVYKSTASTGNGNWVSHPRTALGGGA